MPRASRAVVCGIGTGSSGSTVIDCAAGLFVLLAPFAGSGLFMCTRLFFKPTRRIGRRPLAIVMAGTSLRKRTSAATACGNQRCAQDERIVPSNPGA